MKTLQDLKEHHRTQVHELYKQDHECRPQRRFTDHYIANQARLARDEQVKIHLAAIGIIDSTLGKLGEL